uniref:Apoptosis-antagonizing transcription factor C-terminal domain-containing protein n=1 Tax=Alexandrium andersonii TaxID=327968 RepID=A0A7S2B6L7_9DINO
MDQSLATQMQALAEVEPAKLRQRCRPPPGRHAVFGAALTPSSASSSSAAAAGGDKASEASGAASKPEEGGEAEGAEQDIFDDREFYVQLLREVLASGGKPGESISREDKELQAELQGRRAAKKQAKAQVERRASKGRKIRYVPIEKLQNFMAPRPRESTDGMEVASGLGAVDAMLRALFSGGLGV